MTAIGRVLLPAAQPSKTAPPSLATNVAAVLSNTVEKGTLWKKESGVKTMK